MQREELELSRAEMKRQGDEFELQRQEMEAQNQTLLIQRFEGTFFKMYEFFNGFKNGVLNYSGEDGVKVYFRRAIRALNSKIYDLKRNKENEEAIENAIVNIFHEHEKNHIEVSFLRQINSCIRKAGSNIK